MFKYYLDLFQENIDFKSKSFDRTFIKLGTYEFFSKINPSKCMNEIYNQVMSVKGDGMSLDYSESRGICYLKLSLIYTASSLDEEDEKLLEDSVKVIENYVNTNSTNYELPLTQSEIENESGFFVSIKENGGSGLVNHNEIIELLAESGVRSKLISLNGHWYDRGASSGSEAVLIFVMGAITSGITYDLIKGSLKMMLQYNMVEISKFDDFKFKKLRETVIERTKVPNEEIILTEMYRSEQDIYFNFKTREYEIMVITNKDYRIIELKMDKIN